MPVTEEEAVSRAIAVNVPADFARREFLRKSAESWKSGYGNPIINWEHHIRARWSDDQRKQARGTPRNGESLHPAVIAKQLAEVRTQLREREREDVHDFDEAAWQDRRAKGIELRRREAELSAALISAGATPAPDGHK